MSQYSLNSSGMAQERQYLTKRMQRRYPNGERPWCTSCDTRPSRRMWKTEVAQLHLISDRATGGRVLACLDVLCLRHCFRTSNRLLPLARSPPSLWLNLLHTMRMSRSQRVLVSQCCWSRKRCAPPLTSHDIQCLFLLSFAAHLP